MRKKKINKQELIGKYEYLNHNFFRRVDTSEVLRDLKQLDEPQKVTIPQFVADYIEWTKEEDYHLLGAMIEIRSHKNKETYEWFWDYDDNMELFARAWIFGYEVEKEPKYIVKLKGVGFMSFLNHDSQSDSWSINSGDNGKFFKTHHTRKELEDANFGWVFDCPGIEIEEVTE